jgi:hypothetical protein
LLLQFWPSAAVAAAVLAAHMQPRDRVARAAAVAVRLPNFSAHRTLAQARHSRSPLVKVVRVEHRDQRLAQRAVLQASALLHMAAVVVVVAPDHRAQQVAAVQVVSLLICKLRQAQQQVAVAVLPPAAADPVAIQLRRVGAVQAAAVMHQA